MVASGQPMEADVLAQMQAEHQEPRAHSYRVAAFPAPYAQTDDVIITDECGSSYLLTHDVPEPLPMEKRDVDALGMFYEPSQSLSWHSLPDLRRIIFGPDSSAAA